MNKLKRGDRATYYGSIIDFRNREVEIVLVVDTEKYLAYHCQVIGEPIEIGFLQSVQPRSLTQILPFSK